ncbi:MAG: hypothetical protein HFJ86_09255 [Oscillospiraceae bacterium]|nr:hypothetical protein [Oscillospiraceae bacterium]
MDKEILEQLLLISQGMAHMEQTMNQRFEQIDRRFEQIDERFEQIDERFEQIDEHFERIDGQLKQIDERFEQVEQEIKESEARTKVFIENKVTARIDALVDGYKTVHEKQWELEHRLERLEGRVDNLQTIVSAGGGRTA